MVRTRRFSRMDSLKIMILAADNKPSIARGARAWQKNLPKTCLNPGKYVGLDSCINNYMPNNQFKRGELYSFITGKASTAIARRLQKKFNSAGLNLTIEQWSVLYHLWKQDGISQQELCNATFRDKPSITRLVDNLEKLQLVKRVASDLTEGST